MEITITSFVVPALLNRLVVTRKRLYDTAKYKPCSSLYPMFRDKFSEGLTDQQKNSSRLSLSSLSHGENTMGLTSRRLVFSYLNSPFVQLSIS